jgi:pimeloyl-ACP methyl ester carboxylesterase
VTGLLSTMHRRAAVGTVAVFLGLSVVAPVAGADEETAAAPTGVPTIEWQSCGADFPAAECAMVVVPLDYDRPHGATTHIALARIPAGDHANRIGSVFVNPGGPGGSGVGLVLTGFGEFFHDQLDGRFDVVGFDPRGVGASDPLHCFDREDDLFAFFDSVPVFPYEQPQYRPFYDTYAALGNECLNDGEVIGRHMSTADVARDLDLLREAVGDEALTYLGFSYGSYLGNTYANLFPRNVRALVIDGVLDPRLWSSGWQIESDRVATQEEFDEFLRLCDEAGSDCAFSAPEGAAARWDALASAVKDEPIDLGDGFLYTYDFLIADAASAMYSPEVWGGPDGFAAFFSFLADVALGDESAVAEATRVRAELVTTLQPGQAREADYDNGFDAYYGNQCADTQYPGTFAQFLSIDRYAQAGSQFGPYWWWFNAGCTHWPVADDRYAGPWRTRTSAPVLVVGNYFDGVTDYAGAQASTRLLIGSRLLSYAGWGHTAYGRSACTTEYIDAYLVDGALPPERTVCPANPNPFVDAATRAVERHAPLLGLPPSWLLRPNPTER